MKRSEFVAALAEKIKPALVIVIDALATSASDALMSNNPIDRYRYSSRIGCWQSRTEISKEVLGVPVTAIGIPTVVEAPILIADAIDMVFRSIAAKIRKRKSLRVNYRSHHGNRANRRS